MTLVTSSVESEIHDLHQRHSSIRQKWLDKQRHINELLASAIEICRANEEDIKSSEVRLDPSEIHLNQDFQETLINYIRKHHSVSVKQLTHIFDKDEREIRDIFKSFLRRHLIKYDNEDQTIVSSVEDSPSPQPKIDANPIKRGIPSWMGLPTRRGTLIPRDRPPRDLLHLLSSPTAREVEREKLNVELDHLLNRQTAMEKIRARRFHTNDSIQEYCQYTTRDECPYANPHSSYFRARSSSTSSDDQHSMHNDESQSRKKRKRDESESNDGKDSNRRSSSHYYRKNSRSQSTCGKVHFRRLIKPHTDINLGDCSFLNTCFHMETCKYIHYQIDKTDFIPSNSTNERNVTGKSNRHLPIVQRITPNAVPAQWVQCDLRQFDMSVLGKFSVIMADPPWDIHMELPYGTMADDEMRQLNIPSLQDDGYIFLWVTGRAMELGRECLRIWGYQRCDEVIWVKTNQLQRIIRTGRTGHWLNHGKEHCLVGVKGSPKGNHRGLDSDVIVAEVRATSRKPDEIYGIIERLLPGTRKVELFGRPHNVQPNWITLGNQLDGVRLVEPDVVRRYRQRYPDGYRMSSSGQPQAPSSSSATANDTKPTMSNAALTSK